MKVKELIQALKQEDAEREVVLHFWNGRKSRFEALELAVTCRGNSKNLLILRGTNWNVESIKEELI